MVRTPCIFGPNYFCVAIISKQLQAQVRRLSFDVGSVPLSGFNCRHEQVKEGERKLADEQMQSFSLQYDRSHAGSLSTKTSDFGS